MRIPVHTFIVVVDVLNRMQSELIVHLLINNKMYKKDCKKRCRHLSMNNNNVWLNGSFLYLCRSKCFVLKKNTAWFFHCAFVLHHFISLSIDVVEWTKLDLNIFLHVSYKCTERTSIRRYYSGRYITIASMFSI